MNATITKDAADRDSNFGRRPLARVAGDVRRGTQATAGRLLADTGRKPISVAAFGSNI